MIFNSHTHIGDAFINPPKMGLEELVAPPHGYKFKMMGMADDDTIIKGMREAVKFMEGTDVFVDFREGGIKGIEMLKEALKDGETKAIILGRPEKMEYDYKEMEKIISNSDGIGLSSLSDWDYKEMEKIAEHVHKKKKIFALHFSENKREDVNKVIALEPTFIVHACMSTEEDFKKIAEHGIPVVICPRSNAFFGLKPRVEKLMKYGIDIMLGTDNTMIVKPDIFQELKYLIKNFDVDEKNAMDMITKTPEKVFRKFL